VVQSVELKDWWTGEHIAASQRGCTTPAVRWRHHGHLFKGRHILLHCIMIARLHSCRAN